MLATVVAGSRARRWSLLIAAGLVALGSDGWDLLPALAASVIGVALAWTNQRNRIAGAVAGALIGWAALHLSWPASPTGATALLAGLSVVPLWVSAYRIAPRVVRRRIRVGVAVAVGVVAIGIATAAVFAVTQQGELRAAADDTAAAAREVAGGVDEVGADQFVRNARRFDDVAAVGSSWWMIPARTVPLVSQQVRAVVTAAEAGAELNAVAGELANQVDYDRLRLDDGGIDLAELSGFAEPVADAAATTLEASERLAAVASPWLIGPLAEQLDDFRSELADAESATVLADTAARELPALLGGDGPRRYLMLLGNPAEARDLGGHLGNWAELVASEGSIDVVRVGEPNELFGPFSVPRPRLSDELDLPASLVEMNPTAFPQNWGASPDLTTVATLAGDLFPQAAGGPPIDGVLYADPVAFAALLRLSGPVTIGEVTLDADTAVEYLTRGQFAEGEESVSELIETALDRITSQRLPAPTELADVFGEVVDQGRLQFVSTRPEDRELLELTGLDRRVDAVDGTDSVMVLNRNANPSKIDAYLSRSIDYVVDWAPDSGAVTSRLVITLRNDAPAAGLDEVVIGSGPGAASGTNRTQLAVLSGFETTGVRVDGDDVPWGTRADVNGLTRSTVRLDVPAGGTRTVVVELEGSVDTGDTYRLRWFNQPLVNTDTSRLVIRSSGEPFSGGGTEGVVPLGDGRLEALDVTVGPT